MSPLPTWLTSFFSAPNKLNLEVISVKRPELLQLIQPLLDSAQSSTGPTVLPWSDGKQWWFYCCASDGKETRELQRLLQTRLGSVYSFPEIQLVQQPFNESEQLLLEQYPDGILKLELFPYTDRDKVRLALKEVITGIVETLELLELRPPMLATAQRPVGQILRNLLTACAAQDKELSAEYLGELKSSGALSSQNLTLIELQRLGHLELWPELLQHPKLSSLLTGRIPGSLVELLLTGLSVTEVEPLLASPDISSLRSALFAFEPLFQRPPLLNNCDANLPLWRTWGCGAALRGVKEWYRMVPGAVVAEIERLTGVPVDSSSCSHEAVTPTRPPQTLEQLVALLNQQANLVTDSPQQLQQALSQLSPELLQQLRQIAPLQQQVRSFSEDLEAITGGWTQWFEHLECGSLDGLLQQLTKHQQQWPVESYQEPQLLSLLAGNLSAQQTELVRTMLPVWLIWTEKQGLTASAELLVKLLELLAADDVIHPEDLRLAQQLLERLLRGSIIKSDYQEAIEAYQLVFAKSGSVVAIDRACECIEWLLDQSLAAPDAITQLWREILATALTKWGRLEFELTQVLRMLAGEFGDDPSLLPAQEEDKADALPDVQDLQGQLLVMYGLTEGALQRAKFIIEQRYRQLQVEINHDHSATSKLKHLAQKADYFLFVAGSAKHQAFYPVSDIRSDLIYPKGKGTTSIVRAFTERLMG